MRPAGSHSAIANRRPSCTARSNNGASRTDLRSVSADAIESDSALAISMPRALRSRVNQRSVTRSSNGTANDAAATSVTTNGSRKRS